MIKHVVGQATNNGEAMPAMRATSPTSLLLTLPHPNPLLLINQLIPHPPDINDLHSIVFREVTSQFGNKYIEAAS